MSLPGTSKRRLLVILLLAVLAVPARAAAQSATPSPETTPSVPNGPSVSGQVTGALAKGSTLSISVDGAMRVGWDGLHLVEVAVLSGAQELDRLRFDIEDAKLTVGGRDIVVGTGAVAAGQYLRVSGSDVVVTTGGANLSFKVVADVIETIPGDARFALSVTDDQGSTAEATRQLAEPEGGGITWGTVIAAVLIALLAGGFIGNLFASKRRPPPRASVYGAIQRRIEQDAVSKGGG